MPKTDTNNSTEADYNNEAPSASWFFFSQWRSLQSCQRGLHYVQNIIKTKKDRQPQRLPSWGGWEEKVEEEERRDGASSVVQADDKRGGGEKEEEEEAPHCFTEPQMMSPTITATTANTITRMHIFFRELRWGKKKKKDTIVLVINE